MQRFITASVVVAMAMALALADSAIHSYSDLKHSLKNQAWSLKQLSGAFQRDAGTNAVPPVVQDMKRIASRHAEVHYSLSDELNADILVSQRAVEYLYPVRIEQHKEFVFTTSPQAAMADCVLLDQEKEIRLYVCQE
jgi:hypothetical protein